MSEDFLLSLKLFIVWTALFRLVTMHFSIEVTYCIDIIVRFCMKDISVKYFSYFVFLFFSWNVALQELCFWQRNSHRYSWAYDVHQWFHPFLLPSSRSSLLSCPCPSIYSILSLTLPDYGPVGVGKGGGGLGKERKTLF